MTIRWISPESPTIDEKDNPPPPWLGQVLTAIHALTPLRRSTAIERFRPWLPYAAQPISEGKYFVLVNRNHAPLGLWNGRYCNPYYRYHRDTPPSYWIPSTDLRLPLLANNASEHLAGWFFFDHDAPWNGSKIIQCYIGRLIVAFDIDYERWEIPSIAQEWADKTRAEEQFVSATEFIKTPQTA